MLSRILSIFRKGEANIPARTFKPTVRETHYESTLEAADTILEQASTASKRTSIPQKPREKRSKKLSQTERRVKNNRTYTPPTGMEHLEALYEREDIYIGDISDKEFHFLRNKYGLDTAQGRWKYIKKEHIYKWLYVFLSQGKKEGEFFEKFCACILENHEVKNIRLTKTKFKGGDGGLDGFGSLTLDEGRTIRIAFEAKCWKTQIGRDVLDKLIGVFYRQKLKYGFLITSSIFSDETEKAVKNLNEEGAFFIELINREKLLEMMLRPTRHYLKGFGLFDPKIKNGEAFKGYYLNEDLLFEAVKKPRDTIRIKT